MNILNTNDAPALFITKEGANKIGLKIIARIPTKVSGFKVSEPVRVRGDAGYHLIVFPTDPTIKPEKLTDRALELLF